MGNSISSLTSTVPDLTKALKTCEKVLAYALKWSEVGPRTQAALQKLTEAQENGASALAYAEYALKHKKNMLDKTPLDEASAKMLLDDVNSGITEITAGGMLVKMEMKRENLSA